jgi:hypothetical protein
VVDAVFAKRLSVTAVAKVDDDRDQTISKKSVVTLTITVNIVEQHSPSEDEGEDDAGGDDDDDGAAIAEKKKKFKPVRKLQGRRGRRYQVKPAPVASEHDSDGSDDQDHGDSDVEGRPEPEKEKETSQAATSGRAGGKTDEREERQPLVHAPFFPEDRFESFWFVLGDVTRNALHGITKGVVPASSRQPPLVLKMQFLAPDTAGDYQWMLFVMSDSYIGRDLRVPVHFRVSNAPSTTAVPEPVQEDLSDLSDISEGEDEDDLTDEDEGKKEK